MNRQMMIFLFFLGCSQLPKEPEKAKLSDEVSLEAALNQAQMSYLKGCVEAHKALNQPPAFYGCRDKAIVHRRELDSIIFQDVKPVGASVD